jgi:hypothetical protein
MSQVSPPTQKKLDTKKTGNHVSVSCGIEFGCSALELAQIFGVPIHDCSGPDLQDGVHVETTDQSLMRPPEGQSSGSRVCRSGATQGPNAYLGGAIIYDKKHRTPHKRGAAEPVPTITLTPGLSQTNVLWQDSAQNSSSFVILCSNLKLPD